MDLKFPYSDLQLGSLPYPVTVGSSGIVFKTTRKYGIQGASPLQPLSTDRLMLQPNSGLVSGIVRSTPPKQSNGRKKSTPFSLNLPIRKSPRVFYASLKGYSSSAWQFRCWNVFTKETSIKVCLPLKYRWRTEITSATAWLEKLGLCHDDLRPRNILLTDTNRIKLVGNLRAASRSGMTLGRSQSLTGLTNKA